MTLDEAIKHAEEIADNGHSNCQSDKCVQEHRQLAQWLKMLRHYMSLVSELNKLMLIGMDYTHFEGRFEDEKRFDDMRKKLFYVIE